ncbi:hypothetical protein KQX54_008178 [Cotesia glomerata]|uniref:Uncharacterized protein n=1 Tax=Cotesia glomerata TaxID=32391 RepID=A0AAV7J2F1_COTGL|nr:hypothetical protein KQX54_008178 [Cotesia glomerata]
MPGRQYWHRRQALIQHTRKVVVVFGSAFGIEKGLYGRLERGFKSFHDVTHITKKMVWRCKPSCPGKPVDIRKPLVISLSGEFKWYLGSSINSISLYNEKQFLVVN